jgi:hypothetical protein
LSIQTKSLPTAREQISFSSPGLHNHHNNILHKFENAFGIVNCAKSTIRCMTTTMLNQRAVAEIIAEQVLNGGGARVTPYLESHGDGASVLLNETKADILVSDISPLAPPLTYSKFITMQVS